MLACDTDHYLFVSIHARAERATDANWGIVTNEIKFQSTHAQSVRPEEQKYLRGLQAFQSTHAQSVRQDSLCSF